ncbi:hypothetical protein Tco_1189070 [Tanacetum coccineum]
MNMIKNKLESEWKMKVQNSPLLQLCRFLRADSALLLLPACKVVRGHVNIRLEDIVKKTRTKEMYRLEDTTSGGRLHVELQWRASS